MTLRFMESWQTGRSLAQLGRGRWDAAPSGSLVASGPYGGQCWQSAYQSQPTYTLHGGLQPATVWAGLHWNQVAVTGVRPISLNDSVGGASQVYVQSFADNSLGVFRGNGTQLGRTAANVVPATGWVWLALLATIDPTVGSVQLAVNGTTVLNLTNQNTRNTANSWANQLVLHGPTNGNDLYADVIFGDSAGSVNNGLPAEVRVVASVPSGAGFYAQFPTVVGASATAAVSDTSVDDDTSYIATTNAGDTDTFTHAALPAISATVAAIQLTNCARKDDAGTRTVANIVRNASTDKVGATQSLGTTYTDQIDVMETDPASAAWTMTNVNSAEFGVREVA